jgi:feruloyl esterase
MKRLVLTASTLLAAAAPAWAQPATPADACAALSSLTLANGTVTLAQVVEAGAFVPPAPPGSTAPPTTTPFATLPAFCRVAATLTPSSDSDIRIEVWLPASGWNGKFLGVGNGGWAGTISYGALADGVRRGYAAASTDTGHAGNGGDASFAHNHPEKLTDFAWRAVHEMTVQGKAVLNAYYGKGPRLSYWNGCSTGGRQGLKEAQRFPTDYDAIVAGAPANYMTHLSAHLLWVAHATLKDPATRMTREKLAVIQRAVLDRCDALDGVKDGVLENPPACRFDPAAITCSGADSPDCLTAPQVDALRKVYAPLKNPRTGAELYPGLEPGSEPGWTAIAVGPNPFPIADSHFKFIVFGKPDWDYRTLDFDRDVARAAEMDGGLMNAIDPDLGPFFARGGKLLMYHGWNDQLIAPRNSINYYASVMKKVGERRAADSLRLFMVPGLNHCAGGAGLNRIDPLAALEAWVEQKQPPAELPAAHVVKGEVMWERPVCAYPQVATYRGTGDTKVPGSYVCRAP